MDLFKKEVTFIHVIWTHEGQVHDRLVGEFNGGSTAATMCIWIKVNLNTSTLFNKLNTCQMWELLRKML
jgi:hypothetical protein